MEELARQQSRDPFFRQFWEETAFDFNDHLYRLTEDGEMVQLSLEETERIKKYKRSEIKNQVSFSSIKERR